MDEEITALENDETCESVDRSRVLIGQEERNLPIASGSI